MQQLLLLLLVAIAPCLVLSQAVTFGTPQKDASNLVTSVSASFSQAPYLLSIYHFKLYKNQVIQDWGDATLVSNSATDYTINFNSLQVSSSDNWWIDFDNKIWPVCSDADIPFPVFGPADTSNAQLIGDGTTCTASQVYSALRAGGVWKFNCGPNPVTITLGQVTNLTFSCGTYPCPDDLSIPPYLVVDGVGLVTLRGGGNNRFISWGTGNYGGTTPRIVFQNLKFTNFQSVYPGTGVAQGGGAMYLDRGGSLDLINCDFWSNTGPAPPCPSCSGGTVPGPGQDTAGGAVNFIGAGYLRIKDSRFWDNSCSNGGAIGILQGKHVWLWNTWIFNNRATGQFGNGAAGGNGGNGGGISMDGNDALDLQMCGVVIAENQAGGTGTNGGGLFRTTNAPGVAAVSNYYDVIFDRNSGAGASAGAIFLEYGTPTFKNCIVTRNYGPSANILIKSNVDSGSYTNCLVAGNSNSNGGAISLPTFKSGGSGTLDHVTVFNNYQKFNTPVVEGNAAWSVANSIFNSNCTHEPNCGATFGNGGNNWVNCDSNSLCAGTATVSDPQVGPLAANDFCVLPGSGTQAANNGAGFSCLRNLQRLYLLAWASDKSLVDDTKVTVTLQGTNGGDGNNNNNNGSPASTLILPHSLFIEAIDSDLL